MKLLTKPISSPGRAEKYPAQPPLMLRFLRHNVGSKSRGRSRASPMFIRKKNYHPSKGIETQEPTSPKVTCMGEVHVKKSSKNQPGTRKVKHTRSGCYWVRNKIMSCRCLNVKFETLRFRHDSKKWVFFFGGYCNRKVRVREDSIKNDADCIDFKHKNEEELGEDQEEEEQEVAGSKVYVSNSNSPPKNALLLTRCRSALYRPSLLATKFSGLPLENEETEQEKESIVQTEQNNRRGQQEQNHVESTESQTSKEEHVSLGSSDQEAWRSGSAKKDEKFGFLKELQGSIASTRERIEELRRSEEYNNGVNVGGDCVSGPMMLTRCKSEPAKTGQRLELDPKKMGFQQKQQQLELASHD